MPRGIKSKPTLLTQHKKINGQIGVNVANIIKEQLKSGINAADVATADNVRKIAKETFNRLVWSQEKYDIEGSLKEIGSYIEKRINTYINKGLESLSKEKKIFRNVNEIGNGIIYFVHREEDNLVKIGCTKNFLRRLDELQNEHTKHKLNVLHILYAENMFETEKHFHDLFHKKRIHLEWFQITKQEILNSLNDFYQGRV
jgi:hypothetical protein